MSTGRIGERLAHGLHSLVDTEEIAPPRPQIAFSVLLAVDVLLRFVGGNPVALRSWPALAVLVAVVLCVVAVVVPWDRLPPAAVGVLPVVDIAAVGMARLDSQVSGAGAPSWSSRRSGSAGSSAGGEPWSPSSGRWC